MYTILESRLEVTAEETGVKKMIRCDDPLDWPRRQPQSQQRELANQTLFLLKYAPRSCDLCVFYFNFFFTFIGILIILSKNAFHHVPKKTILHKLYYRSGLKQYKCWVVRVGFLFLQQNDIISWRDTMIQGSRQHARNQYCFC